MLARKLLPRSSIGSASAVGAVPQSCRGVQRRRHDRHIAGAAAQMAAQILAQLAPRKDRHGRADRCRATSECRRCRSRIAAHDGAGRRPAARESRPGAGARPSTVRMVAPSACTASVRQARAGTPSISTVQAPHTPCSQPTWVPVIPSVWRRKSVSNMRGSASASTGRPLRTKSHAMSPVGAQARHFCASLIVAAPMRRTRSRR